MQPLHMSKYNLIKMSSKGIAIPNFLQPVAIKDQLIMVIAREFGGDDGPDIPIGGLEIGQVFGGI
jgi:hypothetical protein